MNAYDKNYLERSRIVLANMLDIAINNLGYSLREFWNMFITSNISKGIESGDSSIIAGKSSIELCLEVINEDLEIIVCFSEEKSQEYWAGWALGYYQWLKGLSFEEIDNYVPIEDIVKMYNPYHEMDIRQFTDKLDELIISKKDCCNLKKIRLSCGLTQSELANKTGIPLRTIQQYEQGQKNINGAHSEYIVKLSKALYCSPSDLLEFEKKTT